jgi:SAM-dependent methyltransferase
VTVQHHQLHSLRQRASTARETPDEAGHGFDGAPSLAPVPVTLGRLSTLQRLAVARERLVWSRRADSWETAGSTGLTEVVAAVLRECRASLPAGAVAVDLGAGSGQVTIPLASSCSRILAIDVCGPLLGRLATKAVAQGIGNIQSLTHPIETLDLPPASLDLVVSNYALHHLRDVDKQRLLERSYRWLRPGGRLVIGDMMFGRGGAAEDRAVIASKAGAFLRRGPGGWWRLLKNAAQFGLRVWEKPLPPDRWEALVRRAGFQDVVVGRVVSEACVLTATRPVVDEGGK